MVVTGETMTVLVMVLTASSAGLAFVWRSSAAWTRIEGKLNHALADSERAHSRIETALEHAATGRRDLHVRIDGVVEDMRGVAGDVRELRGQMTG